MQFLQFNFYEFLTLQGVKKWEKNTVTTAEKLPRFTLKSRRNVV